MEQIASAISSGRYRYTLHAAKQRLARGIKRVEIEQAIARGEIIEDYPQHHYGACCLILGTTDRGRPLHLLCSVQSVVDIITVYEPDPREWEDDWEPRKGVKE